MANYLLAYHGGGMPQTEEKQARVMQAWGDWFQQPGDSVVDSGTPSRPGRRSRATDRSPTAAAPTP